MLFTYYGDEYKYSWEKSRFYDGRKITKRNEMGEMWDRKTINLYVGLKY